MNRLNRQVEYGLMALKVLAQKPAGQKTTAKEISESTGSPFDPTARALQQLKQHGFLTVEQGAQGGYFLSKDLSQVSYYDFAESIMGPLSVARCIHDDVGCELKSTCNIMSPIQVLNKKVENFYKSISIADLLGAQ